MYVTDTDKQGISDLLEIVRFTVTSPLFNSKNTFYETSVELAHYSPNSETQEERLLTSITADGDMTGQLNISVSDLLSTIGCGYPICLAVVVALSDCFYMEAGGYSWNYNKGTLNWEKQNPHEKHDLIRILYYPDPSIFHP